MIIKQNDILGGVSTRIARLDWLWFEIFHTLPDSAWADGKLAELAEHLGKTVEHHVDQSQPNPTLRADTHPCTCILCILQQGKTGPIGIKGSKGSEGMPGMEGPTGAQGFKGVEGHKGFKGEPGMNL